MNLRNEGDELPVGRLSGWLIRRAARTGPPELSERLEEEWLADLCTRSTTISRLRFALGCLWATRVISHDHAVATIPAGASALASGAIAAQPRPRPGFFSNRTMTLALVASLHLAVFYAFVTGLSTSFTKTNVPPLQNRVIDEPRPRDLAPLPPPNLNPVKLNMPRLDADIHIPADDAQESVRDVSESSTPTTTPTEGSSPPEPPRHVATLAQGGPGPGFPSPDDYYPSLSRHLEEQGAATIRVCVDPSGRLTGDPTVLASSGSGRLDEGALKLAKAGSGHYRATTQDGRAIDSCYAFRIRFQMRN